MAGKWPRPSQLRRAKGKIEFAFNPETISSPAEEGGPTEKSTASSNSGFPGGSTGPDLRRVGDADDQDDEDHLRGSETKKKVERCPSWMSPISPATSSWEPSRRDRFRRAKARADISANMASKLPEVTFIWGTGFKYPCNVENISRTYVALRPRREPDEGEDHRHRAEVDAEGRCPSRTRRRAVRPGRGEPRDRRRARTSLDRHVALRPAVVLAGARRGQQIDDPMRVHPGQKVFLPTSEELIRASRR